MRHSRLLTGAIIGAALGLAGCESTEGNVVLGVGLATLVGANSPSQEIQQIYYLGSFDPQGQLPPTVYRIRVHGQASFISFVRFASGWVPAQFIDSLSSDIKLGAEKTAGIEIDKGASETPAQLTTGRRLMLFGPEGFREAPRNHRLVVVMGTSPDDFFEAIDESLGTIAQLRAAQQKRDEADQMERGRLDRDLFAALAHVKDQRNRLEALRREIGGVK